ncbi:MAG: hypothetical protein ACI8PZ_004946 [Myxococcota bacterium]|jgi:hypothetical protein
MRDGIAVLRLGDIGDPEHVHPNLTVLDDGVYALCTFVPLAELATDPEQVLLFLADQLGPVFRRHDDTRGVYLAPEGLPWEGYDELVASDAGFWIAEPEPEPEPPPAEEPSQAEAVRTAAEEALATLARSMRGSRPRASAEAVDPRADAARRYAALAEECARAAQHLQRTAEHFADGDVPKASAHRVAAEGHLVRVRRELDALAVVHADHAR